MNRFRLFGIALFIVAIVLIACSPQQDAQVVRKTPLPDADDFTGAAAADDRPTEKASAIIPQEGDAGEAGDEDDEDIMASLPEAIVDKEKEADASADEYLRELKYMYLFDLTQLTAANCGEKEMEYQTKLLSKQNEIDTLQEDLEEEHEVLEDREETYSNKVQAYQDALASGDEDQIDAAKRDMTDAKDNIDEKQDDIEELQEKLDEAQDYVGKIQSTLDRLRDECKKLR